MMNWLTIKHPLSPRLVGIISRQSKKILSKDENHPILSVGVLSVALILAGTLVGFLLAIVVLFDIVMNVMKQDQLSKDQPGADSIGKEPEDSGFRLNENNT